jgi:hypothetical protein
MGRLPPKGAINAGCGHVAEKVQEISDPLDERSTRSSNVAHAARQQADGHPVENTPGALGDPALSTTFLPSALGGVMTLHKLAAGSGYTYLTRQVAAHDRAERSQVGLAAYYEEKGESPGRWLGGGSSVSTLPTATPSPRSR